MKASSLLFLLLSSLVSFSQIQKTSFPDLVAIGEVKSAGVFIANLGYMIMGKDTTYVLQFNNAKYTSITDIQSLRFNEEGGTLNSLYQILRENIDADKGKENTFKLGKEDVLVKTSKMMGIKYIYFMLVNNGAYFNLTKKQIDKLFNKQG